MPRKKIKRFSELKAMSHVIDASEKDVSVIVKILFKKYNKIILELGCGKGEYTISLAQLEPKTLHVGVDIQGERLWVGATQAQELKLTNAYFIRGYVDHITQFFQKNSIDEIWLTFPDPFIRDKQAKKRLTSPVFLECYKKILKKDGLLHLKTDNIKMFNYSKKSIVAFGAEILNETKRIDSELNHDLRLNIPTYFENMHRQKGTSIKYLKAKINQINLPKSK